jgi:small-conductance mechanosensitive channel
MTLFWVLLLFPSSLHAQIQLNKSPAPAESEVIPAGEDIEEAIARTQESLNEARRKLRSAQSTTELTPFVELGATADEMQKKMSLLYEQVLIHEQHVEAYKQLKETRTAAKDLQAQVQNWKGFDLALPYPISLVDELRDEIHAQELEIKQQESKRSIVQDDLEEARVLLKSAEQRQRKVKEDLEATSSVADQPRVRWLYELSQLENSVAKAKALAAETRRQVLDEVLAHSHQNLAFLEQKLQIAAANAPFTRDDLDKKLAAVAESRKALEKELRQAFREDIRTREHLEEARKALLLAREKLAAGKAAQDEVDRLQRVVDMHKAQADTTSLISEGLKLLIHMANIEELIWENRYRLQTISGDDELKASLEEADQRLEKFRGYNAFFESNLKLAQNLVISQGHRLSEWEAGNGEKELAGQTMAAYEKRVAFFERSLVRAGESERLLERWRAEIIERREHIPLGERLRALSADVFSFGEKAWNFEIFSAEDTIIIDGRPITERRPVTVSKVVRALLILAIGLWLSAVLARRIHAISEKRFKAEHNVARVIEKVFHVIVVICVVFFALVTVKIPLTVFAFLGGALAIGVGFGAQNLINNLVSGIILLFERPIRIGDIVEIDGTRGRVISIGARCSGIRGFDGVEFLVPNSTFLEKNVINWTLSDKLFRSTVKVGVAYGSPTREVSRQIAEALEEHGRILKNPEPVILFEDFGDNALIFSAFFWVEISSFMDFRIIASDIRYMIDKRFREAGITIAFPQRDVHLDHPRPIQIQLLEEHSMEKPPAEPTDVRKQEQDKK